MGSLRRAAVAHACLVVLVELSATPVFAQACSLTGTWTNDYAASVSIVVNGNSVSGNAVFPNVAGDIGFGGPGSDSGMNVPFSPCPRNGDPLLKDGGQIALTLSDCNTATGYLTNPFGGNIYALPLRRLSATPSGGSSCPGGDLPPPPPAGGQGQSFPNPQLNGAPVDWCATWGADCGQAGADQFCRSQGFASASQWNEVLVDRTWVIGSGQFCQNPGACGALVNVVCVGSATPPPPPPGGGGSGGPSGSAEPCQTAEGQQCFESWISEYARLANNYYGSPDYNGRKPWYINQYGLMSGGGAAGPISVYAPDDFPQYGNNRYCWMWGHSSNYQGPNQIAAGIPELRSYVSSCIASRPE